MLGKYRIELAFTIVPDAHSESSKIRLFSKYTKNKNP